MPTLLDTSQIIKRVYDDETSAIKVDLSKMHQVAVSLDANEDSITTFNRELAVKVAVTSESLDVIVPAFASKGLYTVSFFTKSNTPVSIPFEIALEASPSHVDELWFDCNARMTVVQEAQMSSFTVSQNFLRWRVVCRNKQYALDVSVYLVARG
jgi:hypothetical protein